MGGANHTPGPWRVSSSGLTNDGRRPVTSDFSGIAWVHAQTDFKKGDGWMHSCAERDANASLIAAAPDLLDALVALEHEYGPATLRKAAAAIAKAKGG